MKKRGGGETKNKAGTEDQNAPHSSQQKKRSSLSSEKASALRENEGDGNAVKREKKIQKTSSSRREPKVLRRERGGLLPRVFWGALCNDWKADEKKKLFKTQNLQW